MAEMNVNRKLMYVRWVLLRLGLVLFDIFAVNVACYLALIIRFYVHSKFSIWAAPYVAAFLKFAPYYTVCSLLVFAVCGLYKSIWKYAGLHDMNRILLSSVITGVFHVVGTLIFVMRMPITYYVLSAALQFIMITISRFSYRVVLVERDSLSRRRKRNGINVLVVGNGEDCRTVIKYLERDSSSLAHPVCVVDFQNNEFAGTMSGIPVLGGIQRIPDAVRKYDADYVVLADTAMPFQVRQEIQALCDRNDVRVQLFSEYFQSVPVRIPLWILCEYTKGPVTLRIGDEVTEYETAKQAATSVTEKYIVDSIEVKNGVLMLSLVRDVLQPNDIQVDWVVSYQKETGEDVSFF